MVLHVLKEFILIEKVMEVVHLLEHFHFESFPGILVLKSSFLHLDEDVREVLAQI